MDASNKMVRFGLKKIFETVGRDPDKNLPRLM